MLRSLLALCGCCLFLLILSLFVKYLDQRDGFFSLLFNVFSLLRVQEFKSFVFVYFFFCSYLSTVNSFSLSMLLLF